MLSKKKRKSKYPEYRQALATALDLGLNSRSAYIAWHQANNVGYLPRYPERVYKEWVSWNEYLGTANMFRGDVVKPVRAFWEAVKFAQGLASLHDINTMAEWLHWCGEHDGELPADIPVRPDTRYVEWQRIGWPGWLGTAVRSKLAAAKQSTALLCICSHHNLRMPGNKYAVIQAELGITELRQVLARHGDLRVVRCYRLDNELKSEALAVFSRYGRDEGDGWFVPNINDVLFELDGMLIIYRGDAEVG